MFPNGQPSPHQIDCLQSVNNSHRVSSWTSYQRQASYKNEVQQEGLLMGSIPYHYTFAIWCAGFGEARTNSKLICCSYQAVLRYIYEMYLCKDLVKEIKKIQCKSEHHQVQIPVCRYQDHMVIPVLVPGALFLCIPLCGGFFCMRCLRPLLPKIANSSHCGHSREEKKEDINYIFKIWI